MELAALVAAVSAAYDGAARGGPYDAETPGMAGGPGQHIRLTQMGLGLNYWHTRMLRASIDWMLYTTPKSGSTENLARVPGNLGKTPDNGAHALHEVSARLQLAF